MNAARQLTTADFAAAYCKQFGLHLVPLPPKSKRPLSENWGNDVISDPKQAREFFTTHPANNLGVALGPSRLCSLDVDDLDATRAIFDEFGWSLDELIANNPTIQGQPPGMRVMFRVPDGADLPYHSLTWPKQDNPKARFTVFEIRSSADGKQRQDVFPPSIHPDTGEPYKWITRPTAAHGFAPPPDFLLQVWSNWDKLKPQFQDVCPWVERKQADDIPVKPKQHNGTSVIDAYNAANSLTASLRQYGYKQQGKRWLSPHSQTKLPGVNILPDGGRAWIHHASDPLCSDENGQPVAPFDLFAFYEHGGDTSKAVKQAAELLGMNTKPRLLQPQRSTPPANIDMETGEILPDVPANDNEPTPDTPATSRYDLAAVDWFTPLPDVTGKGKPLSTIENLQEICRRLRVTIRYNVISKEDEILIPNEGFSIDNQANASLAWLTSCCSRFGMPTGNLDAFVCYLADCNQYNPVAQWITSKPWDGVSRLQDFYNTIRAEGEADDVRVWDLKAAMLKRWMISAVAGAFNHHGVSAHGVLVLQGDQYLGKTKWFKSLVPSDLGVIQDGMMLRPDDRDSVKQCVANWLVELGELDATFRKADIAALKAFLTRDKDVLRRAYAKKESQYARRTVFFASVNPRQFLHDPTGNRRYWTIACEHIDHTHNLDMQQVWAEVYEALYQNGESWFLQPEEMTALNSHNKDYEVLDPIRERVHSKLDWEAPQTQWRWMTATDLMHELGFDRPSKSDVTLCGQIVQELNGKQSKRTSQGRVTLVPPRIYG